MNAGISFKSPTSTSVNYVGGLKAHITYTPYQIPRNAILIRPANPSLSEPLYNLLVAAWKSRVFEYYSHGSCQQSIRVRDVKELLHGKSVDTRFTWPQVSRFVSVFRENPVLCLIRQVDTNSFELQAGDILLGRIGSKASIARPYLIT